MLRELPPATKTLCSRSPSQSSNEIPCNASNTCPSDVFMCASASLLKSRTTGRATPEMQNNTSSAILVGELKLSQKSIHALLTAWMIVLNIIGEACSARARKQSSLNFSDSAAFPSLQSWSNWRSDCRSCATTVHDSKMTTENLTKVNRLITITAHELGFGLLKWNPYFFERITAANRSIRRV